MVGAVFVVEVCANARDPFIVPDLVRVRLMIRMKRVEFGHVARVLVVAVRGDAMVSGAERTSPMTARTKAGKWVKLPSN